MRDPGRVLILGGGPTGLGVATRLHESGHEDFLLLEAQEHPGGLASSVVDDAGFTWDLGGHVQFSHYAYYDRILDRALGPDEWLWHERQSWVWFKGRFIPYPFQNNLHRLDVLDRDVALASLEQSAAARNTTAKPTTFDDWITQTFGEGLAEIFMRPYNRKVWGYPLDQLDASWTGDRVAVPDLARIKEHIRANRDDVSWGPNRKFRFPRRGGTGAIWRAVAAGLPSDRLLFRRRVARIDGEQRTLILENGRQLPYENLVSTIPLDCLVGITEPLAGPVRQAARALVHSSVHVIGIGLEGPVPTTLRNKCWIYFPEAHNPYYRITVFSNYSPWNVPDTERNWSLMAEVCESPHRAVNTMVIEEVVRAMRTDGLIPEAAAIVSRWHRRVAHGYPTPFKGRNEALSTILPALEERSIFSRGRFGAWKYEVSNQDHSFMQGVELADRFLHGTPEVTVHEPDRANSGVFLTAEQQK